VQYVQYQSSCAPKLARKCGIEHWLPCAAVYGHVITKFSGMGRFTYPWCSAGALRAPELRYNDCAYIIQNYGGFVIPIGNHQCKKKIGRSFNFATSSRHIFVLNTYLIINL